MTEANDRLRRPTGSVVRIEAAGFEITFHGVRGSTPCHGDDIARYGGNTSCVSVDVPGAPPIILDLGTGARYFGLRFDPGEMFDGHCLLSHLHWDHVQGLPFFPPLLRPGNLLHIHGPEQDTGTSVEEIVDTMLCPPLFPVGVSDFPSKIEFEAHADDDFMIGPVSVQSRLIPHIGPTLGFRVSYGGGSVAYLSDHQQPAIGVFTATDNARELCHGVDVLIHDAQYTPDEFARKSDWGHCTIDYALWLARECEVGALVLYHHDPTHDDDWMDRLVADAADRAGDLEVIGAREGMSVRVGR